MATLTFEWSGRNHGNENSKESGCFETSAHFGEVGGQRNEIK
jgi:hypothetical protein